MKFRDLKKKKFILSSQYYVQGIEEHYYAQIIHDKDLNAKAEWEYDNGLYLESGTYSFITTWKDIKFNLTNKDTLYSKPEIEIYNGKCSCGKEISFKQFLEKDKLCDKCFKEIEDTIEED